MGDVLTWRGLTKAPLSPDAILEKSKGRYERVVVVGVASDGRLSIAASDPDLVVCNYDLDRAKHWIMQEVADDENG